MTRFIAALLIASGLGLGATALAADTKPATSPATTTTKPAGMTCCGDTCKKMGNCCKLDASGKASCPMNGTCCNK